MTKWQVQKTEHRQGIFLITTAGVSLSRLEIADDTEYPERHGGCGGCAYRPWERDIHRNAGNNEGNHSLLSFRIDDYSGYFDIPNLPNVPHRKSGRSSTIRE